MLNIKTDDNVASEIEKLFSIIVKDFATCKVIAGSDPTYNKMLYIQFFRNDNGKCIHGYCNQKPNDIYNALFSAMDALNYVATFDPKFVLFNIERILNPFGPPLDLEQPPAETRVKTPTTPKIKDTEQHTKKLKKYRKNLDGYTK